MINIELKSKRGKGPNSPLLIVNGIAAKESHIFYRKKSEKLSATIYDSQICDILASATVADIEHHFERLEFPWEVDWNPHLDSVEFCFSIQRKDFPCVEIKLCPNFEEWANPYSIAEYAEAIERVIKAGWRRGASFYLADESPCGGFGLRYRLTATSRKAIVRDVITKYVQMMKEISEAAEKILVASARRNSLTTFFSFSPAIRTACEQYLLYFIQFLDDLGIKADAEIKEDAQRVLFSVSPADGPTALVQVREALDLYLQLPGMPDSVTSTLTHPNVASQQLQANIFHLKSQIMLAQATLTAKDATIEALQLSNFQYQQIITSFPKSKDREALLGDSVHVTKVETSGLSIDLPLMLRKLKRRFGFSKT